MIREIVIERVRKLLSEARKRRDMEQRYVSLAWELCLKHRVRLPPELSKQFCKKCLSLTDSAKVRIIKGKPFLVCHKCGHRKGLKYSQTK
ncbi:MAG: hypothetical protein QW035_03840 [Candidatus Anstonellales archaeon]